MGLIHGKQLRNNTVGFTKLIADQNLDMSGVSSTFRIVNLADGLMPHHAVNMSQLQSIVVGGYTDIIGGDGLGGSGTTSGGTITLNANVDSQGIFIVNDIIKLGDASNQITGDYTFLDDLHVGGNVVIDGNVTILGTATTINTDELYVKDNRIVVNSNATTGSTVPRYSGLDVFRGSGYTDSASLLWDDTNHSWIIQSPWLSGNTGSATTNNHAILTTGALLGGNAITFTLTNTDDGIGNSLQSNILYDDNTIKLNGSNELYADFGATTADTYVSSAELTGGTTLVLHRNDSVDVLADLSAIKADTHWASGTGANSGTAITTVTNKLSGGDATGLNSVAMGEGCIASGNNSFASGKNCTASWWHSRAGGLLTVAEGLASVAEGRRTVANGLGSYAGGSDSSASGITAFIHSFGSVVTGDRSAVLGGQNITGSTDDTVYIPHLNIGLTDSGTTTDKILVKSSDGTVKEVDQSTISGLQAVPTILDKNLASTGQTSNGLIYISTGALHLTEVPAEGSQVMMLINGVTYIIGSLTTDDIYFTSDDGTTPVIPANVTTSTSIYFKTTTLFELDTDDRIDLIYTVLR